MGPEEQLRLEKKGIPPPFIPKLSSATDTSRFYEREEEEDSESESDSDDDKESFSSNRESFSSSASGQRRKSGRKTSFTSSATSSAAQAGQFAGFPVGPAVPMNADPNLNSILTLTHTLILTHIHIPTPAWQMVPKGWAGKGPTGQGTDTARLSQRDSIRYSIGLSAPS